LNCFNSEVCDSLSSIFASLKDDPNVAAVILTGEGTSFCAGADLSNPPNPLVQSSDLPDHLLVNPVHQMSLLQVPIIGALKGYVSFTFVQCRHEPKKHIAWCIKHCATPTLMYCVKFFRSGRNRRL
jgi:hypothetical protein